MTYISKGKIERQQSLITLLETGSFTKTEIEERLPVYAGGGRRTLERDLFDLSQAGYGVKEREVGGRYKAFTLTNAPARETPLPTDPAVKNLEDKIIRVDLEELKTKVDPARSYTTLEAARFLGLSKERVNRFVRSGRIRTEPFGGKTNIIRGQAILDFAALPRPKAGRITKDMKKVWAEAGIKPHHIEALERIDARQGNGPELGDLIARSRQEFLNSELGKSQ